MNDKLKEVKELLDLMLQGVDTGFKVTADGKVDVQDIAAFIALVPLIAPAFEKIGDVPAELKAMTGEDVAQLGAYVTSKLSIDNAKAAAIVASSLEFAIAGYKLFKAVKA